MLPHMETVSIIIIIHEHESAYCLTKICNTQQTLLQLSVTLCPPCARRRLRAWMPRPSACMKTKYGWFVIEVENLDRGACPCLSSLPWPYLLETHGQNTSSKYQDQKSGGNNRKMFAHSQVDDFLPRNERVSCSLWNSEAPPEFCWIAIEQLLRAIIQDTIGCGRGPLLFKRDTISSWW